MRATLPETCPDHVTAFAIGVQFGILGVAVGYAISSTFVEPLFSWITSRVLGVSPFRIPRALTGVATAAAIMGVIVFAARQLLVAQGLSPFARLLTLTLLGAAVFALACAWRAPEVVSEVRALRRGRG